MAKLKVGSLQEQPLTRIHMCHKIQLISPGLIQQGVLRGGGGGGGLISRGLINGSSWYAIILSTTLGPNRPFVDTSFPMRWFITLNWKELHPKFGVCVLFRNACYS